MKSYEYYNGIRFLLWQFVIEMGRSDITVLSISVDPKKFYERGNRGAASVGENNKVIWYYQLSWLTDISCLLSNKTLKYGWKAPAALSNSLAIFNTVKRMTTWNLLKTVAFLNHLKVSEWEMPAQGCQPLEICISLAPTFEPVWFDPPHEGVL